MADIERWITVNGVHIPIMKGESKARAVGNFIRNRRKQKLDEEYYKKRAEGKNWKEANEAIRKKIKGYNTDPYNKVGKANEAYQKKWESMSKYVNDAKKDYDDAQRYDTYDDKQKIRSKYPEKLGKVDRAKLMSETRAYEDRNERNIDDKRRLLSTLENDRKSLSRSVYDAELNKEYRYKLKNSDNRQNNNSKLNPLATNDLKTLTRGAKFLTSAESKIQDFAQVSSSKYNINNITAKELPSGAIHIMTKEGKDISTINPKALTRAEKNTLRRKGILK